MVRGDYLCWMVGISGKEDRRGIGFGAVWGMGYRSEVWQIRVKRGGGIRQGEGV
jgi:hypothetical protein